MNSSLLHHISKSGEGASAPVSPVEASAPVSQIAEYNEAKDGQKLALTLEEREALYPHLYGVYSGMILAESEEQNGFSDVEIALQSVLKKLSASLPDDFKKGIEEKANEYREKFPLLLKQLKAELEGNNDFDKLILTELVQKFEENKKIAVSELLGRAYIIIDATGIDFSDETAAICALSHRIVENFAATLSENHEEAEK
jgi:hypothetical protein